MSDFELKTTWQNEDLKDYRIKRERYKDLGKIPYAAGAYILTFPNGKTFIGEASNLRMTIKKRLAELFPKPQTIISRKRNNRPPYEMAWMEKARNENPDMKTYQDLEIRAIICNDPLYLKKRLLQEIEGEHYNNS